MPTMPHKPKTEMQIRTGKESEKEGQFAEQYTYGIASTKIGKDWVVHPAWKGNEKCGEFEIEFCSNVPMKIFQSHLAMYDGKKPFCFRAHRGYDKLGVAWRRPKRGGMVFVECDPGKCDLYQQYVHKGRENEILSQYPDMYGKSFKSGNDVRFCSPYNFLVFKLLLPDGSDYAHHELSYCMISTHSRVTNDNFRDWIARLAISTDGRLRGLRMKLEYAPFVSGYRTTPTPAWTLAPIEGSPVAEMIAEAAERNKLPEADATPSSSALVKADVDSNLQLHTSHQLSAPEMQAAATDYLDYDAVNAELVDPSTVTLVNQDPTVRALSEHLGTSYAKQVIMPIAFGTDVTKALEWLVKQAEKRGSFIDHIMMESPFARWYEGKYLKAIEAPIVDVEPVEVEPASSKTDETETESDYTEVDDRTDAELEAASKGQVPQDEPPPGALKSDEEMMNKGKVAPDEEQPTIFTE